MWKNGSFRSSCFNNLLCAAKNNYLIIQAIIGSNLKIIITVIWKLIFIEMNGITYITSTYKFHYDFYSYLKCSNNFCSWSLLSLTFKSVTKVHKKDHQFFGNISLSQLTHKHFLQWNLPFSNSKKEPFYSWRNNRKILCLRSSLKLDKIEKVFSSASNEYPYNSQEKKNKKTET